jgi:hypothetical protein
MSMNPTTVPAAGRLISRLRDTADAYSATGEAIPDRTIRILCDGLAGIHRLFATELQTVMTEIFHDSAVYVEPLPLVAGPNEDPLHLLLDRSCQLEDLFRTTLRADLPNDVDLLIYRLYAKVRRARERLLSALMGKPHLTGITPFGELAMSHCA